MALLVVPILLVLFLVKRYLGFSISNVTLLLLIPLGPAAIGLALYLAFVPVRDEVSVPVFPFLAVVLAIFFADQWFAYACDGSGQGFFKWYSSVVENRSWSFGIRFRPVVTVNKVGGFGYILELVKVVGIAYFGMKDLVAKGWDQKA